MKKILFAILPLLALLLASCDPTHEDMGPGANTDAERLANAITFSQPSPMSNDITFTTSPAIYVQIYDAKGNLLAKGTGGTFFYKPTRGSDTHQTLLCKAINPDGSVIEATKELDVEVAGELSPEMKLLVGDKGKKVWKWNPVAPAGAGDACWGNGAYLGGNGAEFTPTNLPFAWWGCNPETLATPDQFKHSDNPAPIGEENAEATMVLDEDGNVKCYDKDGKLIRSGKFSMEGYTGERTVKGDNPWSLGTLHADELLWPYQINGGGKHVTDFEVVRLTASEMILIYAPEGTGAWSECTWWSFKSEDDSEGCLTNYGKKEWTWNPVAPAGAGDACWGNGGYLGGNGAEFTPTNMPFAWWGCNPETLATPDQFKHSDNAAPIGEEDSNAYMTFDFESKTITVYDKDGKQIRKGSYSIEANEGGKRTVKDGTTWNLGTLHADELLWPYKINGGGTHVKDFEIIRMTNDEMILIYAAEGTGAYSECTWWSFKAK